MLRTVTATRYVTPFREGGSLPGLMEADDLGTYVVKYVGAGQGRKTLIAEIICAGIARVLALPVPPLVLVDVAPLLGRSEPDAALPDLLHSSPGPHLGLDQASPGVNGRFVQSRPPPPASPVPRPAVPPLPWPQEFASVRRCQYRRPD